MEEIELGEQNEKEESDRFVEWAVVNGLRLPTESAQLWWDSHQAQAQLQFICCRDSEISLHVGYSEGEEPKAISWFHATAPHDLYRVQWSTDVVLYDCSDHGNSQAKSSDTIIQLYRAFRPAVSCKTKHNLAFAASSRIKLGNHSPTFSNVSVAVIQNPS